MLKKLKILIKNSLVFLLLWIIHRTHRTLFTGTISAWLDKLGVSENVLVL